VAKAEFENPAGSHKARAARYMIRAAIEAGEIGHGSPRRVLEKTGGNLGLGLALEAGHHQIGVDLVVGLSFSPIKRRLLERFGARLIGIDLLKSGCTPRQIVEHLVAERSREYYFIDQFNNLANLRAHYEETGVELADQLAELMGAKQRKVFLVKGIGSGASIMGIARRLRERFDDVCVVAVEPAGCSFRENRFVDHSIEGISVGIVPPLLDLNIVDRFDPVTAQECADAQDWLARTYGLFPGISSGANIAVARRIAEANPEALVATVIYDLGESYIR